MFSVIIPLYNKAPYLQRALDSVYAQRVAVDEIIVVDDGSTDGGGEIAKRQRDARVRVIEQANRGVSAARNVGIAAATQPYLAFLDADDLWLPDFLARVREMVETCPGAALYGTGFATVAGGRETGRYGVRSRGSGVGSFQHADAGTRGKPLDGGGCRRPAFGPVDFFKEWARGHVLHTSSMAVPRDVALRIGGFPEGVTHGEDHEFWARLALAGPVVLSPDVLTQYDVGVPGQAVEFWQQGYKERFEVLPYHRFLAQARGKGRLNTGAQGHGGRGSSFETYCRREFRVALLQRLYWERFDAAQAFCEELGLCRQKGGLLLGLCCWTARSRFCQPAVICAARLLRALRSIAGG